MLVCRFTLAALFAIASLNTPCALADDTIPFRVEIPGADPLLPLPAVFISGELKGTVLGVIPLALGEEETIVEIGYVQIRNTPIYSFTLTKDDWFSKSIEVTYSNIHFAEHHSNEFWSDLRAFNNTVGLAEVRPSDGVKFNLVLPPNPYVEVSNYIAKREQVFSDGNLSGILRYDEDLSLEKFVAHKTYDKDLEEIVMIFPSTNYWSGNSYFQNTSLPGGLSLPKARWRISSTPQGANIYTEKGGAAIGTTNTDEIEVEWTRTSFLSIKKQGYFEITDRDCARKTDASVIVLACTLRPIP